MNKRNTPHPPKKKHANKPRSDAVLPWTESERQQRGQFELSAALRHLEEAKAVLTLKEAPIATVSRAYYAMHHCAISVILASGGVGKTKSFPESHVYVISHFSKIAEKAGGLVGQAGVVLNEVFELRKLGDYGTGRFLTNKDAVDSVSSAVIFIEACRKEWNLIPHD